jgi:hypothetical protein
MTTDRDIRFSPFEITITQLALRDELRKRERSIAKAEAARAGGQKVQEGTLQEHYEAREAARRILENLEVARKQIAYQIAERVGAA